ncbi:arginine kinase-like [Dysidea avara]|uniref:arginine kinase-like n=1 Tax=Dysidea avara TaxID=196820 RepID=UPI003318D871
MEYPAVFLKPEVHSLAKKYVTPEVFEEHKNKKTSRGYTLLDCMQSGIQNLDSDTGLYAGDEECYTAFGNVLDNIVEDYHAPYKIADGHTPDMNPDHLNCPNPDPEGKYIRSTRIRVARNLKGYGLAPNLGKQERLDIERKVVEVLTSLTGDLAGKYYPLQGMDEATRQKLVDDHFLFKKGDRFLESAGCNKEWPEGRGIYHNDAKTFLVWINEEDQLRIISMEKGSDIGSVFRRLCKAVNEIDAKLGFQHSPGLGYITSCPTNLGTGMRASVHVKIPKAHAHPDFKAICDKYHIQPRGIHGEHSESTGEDAGVYDISNRRRLGLSEVRCVQDMYDGLMKLLEIEKS